MNETKSGEGDVRGSQQYSGVRLSERFSESVDLSFETQSPIIGASRGVLTECTGPMPRSFTAAQRLAFRLRQMQACSMEGPQIGDPGEWICR